MRAVVTGSSGFIGSHLVRALKARGDLVYTFDKKDDERQDLAAYRLRRHGVFNDPDVVFHLAGSCSTPGSVSDPFTTFSDTVISAANVIEYGRENRVPVIVTSSVKARDGMTPYGAAKQMVETWALETSRTFGSMVVINRPGTVYGPGQEGSIESGWIAWFLKAAAEKIPVTINGDGKQRRDLLHVSDYVRLMLLQADDLEAYSAIHPDKPKPRIWDVGGGVPISVKQMADYLKLEYTFGPERTGDARLYVGRNDVPGWVPEVAWQDSEVFRGYR